MFLKRFFRRVRYLLKRLFASTEVKEILQFTTVLKEIVESPSTTDVIALTPTEKDDKVLKKVKESLSHIDTFKEITAKVKDKEGLELITYFVDRIRGTKKAKRGVIYLSIASEILRFLNEKYSRTEADTVIQLAYTQQKIG